MFVSMEFTCFSLIGIVRLTGKLSASMFGAMLAPLLNWLASLSSSAKFWDLRSALTFLLTRSSIDFRLILGRLRPAPPPLTSSVRVPPRIYTLAMLIEKGKSLGKRCSESRKGWVADRITTRAP